MNSVIGPSFNENFAEKSTSGSHEQCTGPTDFDAKQLKGTFSSLQTHAKAKISLPNSTTKILSWF